MLRRRRLRFLRLLLLEEEAVEGVVEAVEAAGVAEAEVVEGEGEAEEVEAEAEVEAEVVGVVDSWPIWVGLVDPHRQHRLRGQRRLEVVRML